MNFFGFKMHVPHREKLGRLLSAPRYPILVSFLATLVLFVSCFWFTTPKWETNDDLGMSMLAHGYGAFTRGSPNLIFSNVVWGWVVRAFPKVFGILGYTSATICVLYVLAWFVLTSLVQRGTGWLGGGLALVLIMARPLFFPQFTINAGLLTMAAIFSLFMYTKRKKVANLAAFCALAYCGYLIRRNEFFLVLFISLPFLPWRALFEQKKIQIAFLLLCTAILVSAYIDRSAYSTPEWKTFNALNQARIPFNDFGASEHLKSRPDITEHCGFSNNDLDLIRAWFFVDPKIANIPCLNAMIKELDFHSLKFMSVSKGAAALKAFISPEILPVVMAALLLALLFPRASIAISWAACLGILFLIGMLGRPGVIRIYIPLVSLLCLIPLFLEDKASPIRRKIAVSILFGACVWNLWILTDQSRTSSARMQQVQKDLEKAPSGIVIKWGGDFFIEYAFPVMDRGNLPAHRLLFYALGSFTHVPTSIASFEESRGHGMVEQLLSDKGILLIATPHSAIQEKLGFLAIYCKEHHRGRYHSAVELETPSVLEIRAKCTVDKQP